MGWTVRESNPGVGDVVRTSTDWPGNHSASCPMGFLPRVNQPGRDVEHPPQSSTKVKERIVLYLYSPICAFMACYRVNFVYEINQILMCIM